MLDKSELKLAEQLPAAIVSVAEGVFQFSTVCEIGLLDVTHSLDRLANSNERIASALETLANRDVTTIDAPGKP